MSARLRRGIVPKPAMRLVVRRAVRPVLGPDVPVPRQRRLLGVLSLLAVHPAHTQVTPQTLGGLPTERVAQQDADTTSAVLYLHGGGYTVGDPGSHRALAAHLAAAAGVPVHLLDYRLAPEHPFPAALDDAVAAYDALLASGLDPERIAVAGDSAGGGLTVALALRLRERGTPLPGALALISPWVDLTLGQVADDPRDPMLRVSWLSACARRYAGSDGDPGDPLLSPLLADDAALAGLPPTIVHGSSDEILLGDVERLVARLETAGVDVTFRRLPDAWHVIHLHAGLVAESTAAAEDLGRFVARQLRRVG